MYVCIFPLIVYFISIKSFVISEITNVEKYLYATRK